MDFLVKDGTIGGGGRKKRQAPPIHEAGGGSSSKSASKGKAISDKEGLADFIKKHFPVEE
jgi:hypothetical protein